MIDFKLPYDRARYLSFLKTQLLPEDFVDSEENVSHSFEPQFIRNIIKLGEVPSLDLCVYEAEHPSENDPRVALSRDAFRLMAQYGKKRALIFLVSKNSRNFRLSLVTIDLKWEEGKRIQKEYSNPRRYSFFLGPETKTHTPQEYLVELGRVKDFEDLKKRFSIEVVNKEFYTQIAMLFTQLAGGKREIGRKSIDAGDGDLKLPSTNDDTVRKEFTVRLIGRLVFCWFLKKKKSDKGLALLSENLLSAQAVQENKGYYHSILEPLFFEVLNTQVGDRDKKYKSTPWNQTPFLNGGLFNPHHHDFYDPGTIGVSKHINTLKIPDGWFKELFEVFETYNFTIDENTSVDVELSIEPEMLGRIFENLLAEINPETGETARKATGSYYTPRSIVECMVDESLKQCLLTKTGFTAAKISALLSYSDQTADLNAKEKEKIIEALDTIKIIDPACGSGAFPMGMLQKMLLILQKIDPKANFWIEKKIKKTTDPDVKSMLKSHRDSEQFNYIRKLGIIRDAIYGVDIQPIAVEISKLRFFLSLIVDEKVNDIKDNRGIEPLPNLEFKFVCANSLMGLPQKDTQQTLFESNEDIATLKNLRDEYLRSFGKEKKKIEKKFHDVQSRMFKHSLNWGGKDSQTLKLSEWKPFSEDPCSWFDSDWMFGVTNGFDVVIGNPPYGLVGGDQLEARKYYNSGRFKLTAYKTNLYLLFLERGLELLNAYVGAMSFIIPKSLVFNSFFENTRRKLLEQYSIPLVVEVREKVFEAAEVGDSVLFFARGHKPNSKSLLEYRVIKNTDSDDEEILTQTNLQKDLIASIGVRFRVSEVKIPITQKNLGDIWDVNNGLNPGNVRHILLSKRKLTPKHRKMLLGRDLQRYVLTWSGNWVNFDPSLKDKIKPNQTRSKKGMTAQERVDFALRPAEIYKPKKVLVRKTADHIIACFDFEGLCFDSLSYGIQPKYIGYNPKFLLGLLNSKFLGQIHAELSQNQDKVFAKVLAENLRRLPMPNLVLEKSGDRKMHDDIVELVNRIIEAKQTNMYADTSSLEREIDKLVYNLYGLTKEEIAIVEGGSPRARSNGQPAKPHLEKARGV